MAIVARINESRQVGKKQWWIGLYPDVADEGLPPVGFYFTEGNGLEDMRFYGDQFDRLEWLKEVFEFLSTLRGSMGNRKGQAIK